MEKITASNNDKFKNDHNQGAGQINSNAKLLFLILKLSISIQFIRIFNKYPERKPADIGSK